MVSLQAAIAVIALSGTGQAVTGQTEMLDFYADWCAPCRAMDPTIQRLAAKGYPIRKINIDRQPALKQQYGVQSIPCYVMLVGGKEIDRVVGSTSLSRLQRMCAAGRSQPAPGALPGASPVLLAQAAGARALPPASPPPAISPPAMANAKGAVWAVCPELVPHAVSPATVPAQHSMLFASDLKVLV